MSTEQVEKCSKCGHVVKPYYRRCPKCEGDKNRSTHDRLRDVIVEFKESATKSIDPERERDLVKLLVEYGHPDVDGLVRWVEEQRNAPKVQQKRRYA